MQRRLVEHETSVFDGAGVGVANPPKLVCLIGLGRTGTNHFTQIISCVPEIDSRRELFNPRRCYRMDERELRELSRRTGLRFPPSIHKRKAVRVIRRHPTQVLDTLLDLLRPPKRLLSFKVFVDQLTVRQVRRSIINRPDSIIIFIRRRPIETYVSRLKALRLKQWVSTDTTDLKIDLDFVDFVKWWRHMNSWYRRLEAACWVRGKPFHRLTYEDDIDIEPERAVRRFCAILERHGHVGLTIPDGGTIPGLRRQDRASDVRDRVSNWPEFERGLAAMGALDKAFTHFPGFEPRWWHHLHRALRVGPRRHVAPGVGGESLEM